MSVVCADNLEILRGLDTGALDLIYVDPPFGTGKTRSGRGGAFEDRLALEAYLGWIRPRLVEMHRVLKPTGSLFVHLDWRAVHYVKVELDGIFGLGSLVNEIVWTYSVGGKGRRTFGRKHDTILWYARGPAYAFYPERVRVPRKAGSHMKVVVDQDGREVQIKRDRRTGKIYSYPVHAGKIPDDTWTDIETLNRGDRQRTGWPTQKPEALLERIMLATTLPGDHVADFCCGSGTLAVVAERLGRRFLAVDVSDEACRITRSRLARVASSAPSP